jgi:hypothetical protein
VDALIGGAAPRVADLFCFDERPICVSCAERSGMVELLHTQQAQLAHIVEQAATDMTDHFLTNLIDEGRLGDIIMDKMKEGIRQALDANESVGKYEEQLAELRTELETLRAENAKADKWKQRAETAEEELHSKRNQKLNEQQIFEMEGFRDNGNGTVTQNGTGLTWMRFSLGQLWEDGAIHNTPDKVLFSEALNKAKILNKRNWLGHNKWRVPTIGELKSILKRGQRPSISHEIFPGVNSSTYIASHSKDARDKHRIISFRNGVIDSASYHSSVESPHYCILVTE